MKNDCFFDKNRFFLAIFMKKAVSFFAEICYTQKRFYTYGGLYNEKNNLSAYGRHNAPEFVCLQKAGGR